MTSSSTFVFSLYGQYVLPQGEEEIWIGSLIQALGALDFKSGAVRMLVSRMKHKGFLCSRRLGRHSFYRLTDRGLREVRWGSDRAFASPKERWDGRWTVVTYSVPEKHRKRRGLLRRLLDAWGFGALAPGAWISPRSLSSKAEEKLRELNVWKHLELFRGQYLGSSDSRELVAHAWPQLPSFEDRYRAYVASYEPALRCFEAGALDDEACFAARLQSLIDFVSITLDDPALPPSLLPEDWPRPSAQLLFKELLQVLTEPAERFFDTIYRKGRNE